MISTEQKSSELQEKKLLIHAIRYALYQGHSFSLWKTPTKNEKFLAISTSGVRQINEISLEDSETGFIFSPFLPDAKKIFFPADILYRFEDGRLIEGPASDNFDSTSGTIDSFHLHYLELERNVETPDFKNLVESGIEQIEAGVLEKIVPSRFKDISLSGKFDLLRVFDLLCEKHPNALISMVSSPATGTWMGATPELLVSTVQNKFKTVALAGTLPYSPEINLKSVAWTQKEIEEQALVCRYIINCFKKIRLREYEEHGPKTTVAGNLMHLKTDYEVDMLATNFPQLGSVMLKLLHPTSAVCGMPLENSLAFLKTYEGYNRQFYSGYLGPVNVKKESLIYVNLRCMQLFPDRVRLYAGAGVTADSVAETEWNETEMKMLTLQKIIAH
ncbi:MAG TPA: chorismate-binding protein [Cyclobacteriaceae bacterium]|nr:chorismate-binding protein [Cyclobacteriaceae bacterium]